MFSPLLFCFSPLNVSSDLPLVSVQFSGSRPQIHRGRCVKVAAERAQRSLLAWFRFKGSSLRARAFVDVQQRKLTNLREHVRQRKQIRKKLICICWLQRSDVSCCPYSWIRRPFPLISAAPSWCRQPGWTVDRLCSSEPFTSSSGPSLKTAAFKAFPASGEASVQKQQLVFQEENVNMMYFTHSCWQANAQVRETGVYF